MNPGLFGNSLMHGIGKTDRNRNQLRMGSDGVESEPSDKQWALKEHVACQSVLRLGIRRIV